jgi:hypothetical protein
MRMRLAARDTRFELRVVGYQFPGNATAEYDSNWLVIEGAVRHPRGDWRFRDPSLLTYEVARLADWLEAVASGTEPRPWCGFIEPNLSFDVAGEGVARVLRVSFGCESLPPWAARGEEVAVEFPVAGLDLGAAAASLRGQLGEFPQRAER